MDEREWFEVGSEGGEELTHHVLASSGAICNVDNSGLSGLGNLDLAEGDDISNLLEPQIPAIITGAFERGRFLYSGFRSIVRSVSSAFGESLLNKPTIRDRYALLKSNACYRLSRVFSVPNLLTVASVGLGALLGYLAAPNPQSSDTVVTDSTPYTPQIVPTSQSDLYSTKKLLATVTLGGDFDSPYPTAQGCATDALAVINAFYGAGSLVEFQREGLTPDMAYSSLVRLCESVEEEPSNVVALLR